PTVAPPLPSIDDRRIYSNRHPPCTSRYPAPTGLAAAYIYIAAMLLGIRMLQHDISSVSKVTEVTVRNRCREILSNYRIRLLLKPAQS
ncbi:MAG: hypothetical protein QXV18_04635, partial [Candidatus Nitrosocaldus sp.]